MKPFLDNKMSIYEEYGAFKFIYLSIFVISHQLWISLLGLTDFFSSKILLILKAPISTAVDNILFFCFFFLFLFFFGGGGGYFFRQTICIMHVMSYFL